MKELKIKSFRDLAMPKYLHGDDLRGQDLPVTVTGISEVEVWSRSDKAKVPKAVLSFANGVKPIIMNSVKAEELAEIFPELVDEPMKLIGKNLVITTKKEKHFGVWGNVLHFKKYEAPTKKKDKLAPDTDKWEMAVGSLAAGNVTVDQIKKFYTITKAHLEQLSNEAEALNQKGDAKES